MDLFGLLIVLVIAGLAFWATRELTAAFGIPAPIVTLINVLIVVFVVLYLLNAVGGVSIPGLRLRR